MSKKRIFCLIMIGLLLSGISVFATYLIDSSDVSVDFKDSEGNVIKDSEGNDITNVQAAIDDLLEKCESSGSGVSSYEITYNAQNGESNTTGTSGVTPTYGDLPTPTKSGYTFIGWYDAATGGNRITSSTAIAENKTIYAHWADSQFGADTWDTILDYVRNHVENDTVSRYSVGDTKEVDLGTYGVHTVRVSNNSNYDCTLESKTACGFVVEFSDIITTHNMNSSGTNVGGWPATSMRSWLNSTLLAALPSELQNVIAYTTVVSGHGPASGESNFTSTDKLYLLSAHEVWTDVDGNTSGGIDSYDTSYSSTRQLDYYATYNNTQTTTSSYSKAIKYNGSSAAYWWLRAARSTAIDFLYVFSNGNWATNRASNPSGVSPAFRIE